MNLGDRLEVAVVIPCLNEETAIGEVVRDFAAALPMATIFVFDNGSDDRTTEEASAAGAEVRQVPIRGKGNVIRRMFADIEADIYVLVDGDATYEAAAAPGMVERLRQERLDMVVGCRNENSTAAYRPGHRLGNRLFNQFLAVLFGASCQDMFSGYRVFSRRFVKSFPAQSTGFETETELTVHALELRMPIAEQDTRYIQRAEGSASKLNTFRDGWRILLTMLRLYRIERPFHYFSLIAAALSLTAVLLALPLLLTYLETGLVPRIPTAILATGLMLLASLSLFSGLVLDTVAHGRREAKMLVYLNTPYSGRGFERTMKTPRIVAADSAHGQI
jgi:glycosyltransferase involved in cell wall biosynthesis